VNLITYLLYLALTIYLWLIIARALLSWFPLRPGGLPARLYSILFDITEPYLGIFRRVLPMARVGSVGIDLSALLGVVVLLVLLRVVAAF
jgi:YggT family protein